MRVAQLTTHKLEVHRDRAGRAACRVCLAFCSWAPIAGSPSRFNTSGVSPAIGSQTRRKEQAIDTTLELVLLIVLVAQLRKLQ